MANLDLLHEASAEDVVQDALEALLAGKCPRRVDVAAFLFNRVRQSVFNRVRRRHARAERLARSTEPLGCALPAPQPDVVTEDLALASDVGARLSVLVGDDADVRRLLTAYASGLKKRADLCAELGMNAE